MIWYCDTETVQLTTENVEKAIALNSVHTDYIINRLEQSRVFVVDKKLEAKKTGIPQTLMTLNVFNSAISEKNEIVKSDDCVLFLEKLARKTRRAGEKTATLYFHNVKFDLTNHLDRLHFSKEKYQVNNSLIVGTKVYNYCITVFGVRFTYVDSFNLTMCKLSEFGKAFGLAKELWKSEYEFDFSKFENIKRMMLGDRELEEYGIQDVRCLKAGVEAFKKFAQADKLTLASTAFENWEKTNHPQLAELTLEEQLDANMTYTGAICYVNPDYREKILEGDYVYIDNNGLYSAAMYSECAGFRHPYPVGMGKLHENGEPDLGNIDKYYTIRARIRATVKEDTTVPFFRLGKQSALGCKFSKVYKQSDYLRKFDETVYINSIDLRLLYKYYNVEAISYDYFWEYDTEVGMFDEYIDYWIAQKTIGTETGNKPLRTVSKFMNNSLSGKFGQMIEPIETVFDFDEKNNILKFERELRKDKDIDFIYMPIVSAILAYAREIFLDMTESYPESEFVYCDTDSNILTREAFEKYVDKKKIHNTRLGAWKIENEIAKLKVLRQKTYMYTRKDGKTVCKCAGATDQIKTLLNYDNFNLGEKIENAYQLKPRLVPGGTALVRVPFVLRESFMGL